MQFSEYLRSKHGSSWVLTQRLTPSMKARGYTLALTEKMYRQAELEWAAANPAEVLAQLPSDMREMLTAAGLLKVAA
jgi:hypothetical protein